MSGVDDRIVAMKFDNAVFQERLAATLQSLDKLRGSLDFTNGVRNIGDLGGAAKNFDMNPMSNAVEGVSKKFLALATVGITALSNITTKVLDTGLQMAKSLTVQPLLDGFREYETNIGSIQTILANTNSKGSTLKDVNKALDELNAYSDKTIYNFSEMARNIGTFTAAGISLDKSVSAIKGIANLAAISGSTSEQASTAMYQLSQALASGSVKLMDWNSVVNAGMGGEVFQKALFETGKKMKTIANVPLGMTFDEWKKKGNNFRETLQDGWLTADVLTQTLNNFTGDLTDAQLKAQGYTKEQITEIQRLGKVGLSAATEIKTFSQLMDTVKESVGSGWSTTFRTLVGDFDQAKSLFTGMGTAITGMVGESAKARNDMLQGWANLGGRDAVIQSFKNVVEGLGGVVKTVSTALREFFPKTTSQELFDMTKAFENFTEKLKPSEQTLDNITQTFRAVFSTLKIGWEVVKGVIGVFGDLFSTLTAGGGDAFSGFADGARAFANFNDAILESGAIPKFFDNLGESIKKPIQFLKNIVGAIANFVKSFGSTDVVTAAVDDVSGSFERLDSRIDAVRSFFDMVVDKTEGVRNALAKVGKEIADWFKELGSSIAKALHPGDFDAAVDVVNVGLLGGIALMLKKFVNGGFKLDFGDGIMEKVSGSLDQLTGTLKTMQASVKADILLKIAGAVGILAASMLVLSTIDSASLTRALVGMAVGFGELIAVMALLDKFSTKTTAIKMAPIATGLMLLSTSMLILSAAVKNLSGLSWTELTKGLVGVGVSMGIMVGAINLMSADTGGLIRAGLAMMAMGISMRILAEAVGVFGSMDLRTMAKGLGGIAAGLLIIAGAMNLMPVSMPITAAGILILGGALNVLALAVLAFGSMALDTMAKGLGGIAAGLVIIAGAMNLMPLNLPITAAGMVILAGALTIMAGAIFAIGSMDFGSLAKGVGGLAATLLILVVAMNAMNSAVLGAASLVIISGALAVMAGVLKVLGSMSIAQIATALGALTATFIILGGAAAALGALTPQLFALAASMTLIGTAAALFGVGAMLIAKAFEVIAKVGREAMKVLVDMIGILLNALPHLVQGLFDSLKLAAMDLLNTAPLLLKVVTVILKQLLETVTKLAPSIAEAIGSLLTNGLALIREQFPNILRTGIDIVLTLLRGIANNAEKVLTAATNVIVSFTDGLVKNMPRLVEAATNLIVSFAEELAKHAEELVAAGLGLIVSLVQGITNNVSRVVGSIANLIIEILTEITISAGRIVEAGANLLIWLMQGITENLTRVVSTMGELVVTFITALGNNQQKIITAGLQLLTNLIFGLISNITKITEMVGTLVVRFIGALSENAQKVIDAGANMLVKFITGLGRNIDKLINVGGDFIIKLIEGLGTKSIEIINATGQAVLDFLDGLDKAIVKYEQPILDRGITIAQHIVEGIVKGIGKYQDRVFDKLLEMAQEAWHKVTHFWEIFSPSKKFMWAGEMLMKGLAIGIEDNGNIASNSAVVAAEKIVRDFAESIAKMPDGLPGVDISPVITPVLDLTQVQSAARGIDSMLKANAIVPEVSIDRARQIATTTQLANEGSEPQAPVHNEYNFEQNVYSPTALSTGDIYRNTKSLIAMEKEELGI